MAPEQGLGVLVLKEKGAEIAATEKSVALSIPELEIVMVLLL